MNDLGVNVKISNCRKLYRETIISCRKFLRELSLASVLESSASFRLPGNACDPIYRKLFVPIESNHIEPMKVFPICIRLLTALTKLSFTSYSNRKNDSKTKWTTITQRFHYYARYGPSPRSHGCK